MNAAMRIECERYLRAAEYAGSTEGRGHVNGFKPKAVKTKIGEIELKVPQTHDSGFYPNCLTNGSGPKGR